MGKQLRSMASCGSDLSIGSGRDKRAYSKKSQIRPRRDDPLPSVNPFEKLVLMPWFNPLVSACIVFEEIGLGDVYSSNTGRSMTPGVDKHGIQLAPLDGGHICFAAVLNARMTRLPGHSPDTNCTGINKKW